MSKSIFVDTGAFLALSNAADQYHDPAREALKRLQAIRSFFVTSNFVLDDTYTRIRRKAGIQAAVRFGEQVQSDSQIKIIVVDRALEKTAWEIFKKYDDHHFSYTDCTSFALMRKKEIREAFAFDKDFKIFGYTLVPGNL